MTDRSAVDTIRGYFYQFDHSILSVLHLAAPDNSIAVECIEDIDIRTATELTAVQCKYYAGTDYNHSVIKSAVMHMLTHFEEVKSGTKPKVSYVIRGHYQSGHSKLTAPINVTFLKKHFLTHVKNKVEYRHYEELGLDDNDLEDFLLLLTVDINAASFEEQFLQVVNHLQSEFKCTPFASEYFYYNNALALIRGLAIQHSEADRTITKGTFLAKADTSGILFNEWFVRKKGKKAHFAALRNEYFAGFNLSAFERFFLVEINLGAYVRSELKEVLHTISRKWSKTTKRDGNSSFCPFVYVHGISASELVALKKELCAEEFLFIDGYDFQGADFSAKSIARQATYSNGIRLKILNSIVDLTATMAAIIKTREVYQFYLKQSYFLPASQAVKHINIQVEKLTDVIAII